MVGFRRYQQSFERAALRVFSLVEFFLCCFVLGRLVLLLLLLLLFLVLKAVGVADGVVVVHVVVVDVNVGV